MDVHACFANHALASFLTCISAHGVIEQIPPTACAMLEMELGVISRKQLGGGESARSKLASTAWHPLVPSWVSRAFRPCCIAKYALPVGYGTISHVSGVPVRMYCPYLF